MNLSLFFTASTGSFGTVYLGERCVGEPPFRQFALKVTSTSVHHTMLYLDQVASKKKLRKLRDVEHLPDGSIRQINGLDKVC